MTRTRTWLLAAGMAALLPAGCVAVQDAAERREIAALEVIASGIRSQAPAAEVVVRKESTGLPWIEAAMPARSGRSYLEIASATIDEDTGQLDAWFRNGLAGQDRPMTRLMTEDQFGQTLQRQAVEIGRLQDEAQDALDHPSYDGGNFIAQNSPRCRTGTGRCSFSYREWSEGHEPANVWLRNEDGSRYVVPSPQAIARIRGQ